MSILIVRSSIWFCFMSVIGHSSTILMFYILTLNCSEQGAIVLMWFFYCDGVFWFGWYVIQFCIYLFTFIYLHISIYLLLMYVFVHQSIYLFVIYLSLISSLIITLYFTIYLFIYISIYLSFNLSVHIFLYLFYHLHIFQYFLSYIDLYNYFLICVPIYLLIHSFISLLNFSFTYILSNYL